LSSLFASLVDVVVDGGDGEDGEDEEDGEVRAKAVVTAKLPPAEIPLKNTRPISIPNSSALFNMYTVESIQSFTGIGWGYSGARRYSIEMNIAPRPITSSVLDALGPFGLLASVEWVRVHQFAHRESSVPLPIVNPPPWKLITQGRRRLELGLDSEDEDEFEVEGEEEGS